jgi:V8-like Glu-specific endopeptidase
MPNFSRAEQNKQGQLHPAQLVLRALIGLILLAALLPLRQVNAAPAGADPLDMLIYKEYGNPDTTLQNMPPPCEGGDECDADSTDFYKPFGPTAEAALAAGSRSDMVEVMTTEMWPFAPTVKLFSYWPSGEMTTCSGMMVDARVMLTAGSCVYTHNPSLCSDGDSACWVADVSAVPAYADGEAPFGQSGYESIMAWTNWTEAQNQAFDLAAIRLRSPIGDTTGWLGVGFNNENAAFTGNTLANTAYLQDSPYDGESMYGWEGTVTDADSSDDIFYINGNCDSGRIGASLNGQDGVAYGIFSYSDLSLGIGVTRITYSKFDSLRTFIEEGPPKEDNVFFFPIIFR